MDKAIKKRLGTGLYASGILLALAGTLSWLALSNRAQAVVLLGTGLITAGAGLYINHSYRTRQGTARTALYVLLVIGALIMMFPFYWMISSSFKTSAEMSIYPPTWSPRNWLNFDNFRIAFRTAPFEKYFINSVIVTASSVAATAITTILAAFAFSRLNFPGREIIFSLQIGRAHV